MKAVTGQPVKKCSFFFFFDISKVPAGDQPLAKEPKDYGYEIVTPIDQKNRSHVRLQSVPFWIDERVRSQRSETGARRNKREGTGDNMNLKVKITASCPSSPPKRS